MKLAVLRLDITTISNTGNKRLVDIVIALPVAARNSWLPGVVVVTGTGVALSSPLAEVDTFRGVVVVTGI